MDELAELVQSSGEGRVFLLYDASARESGALTLVTQALAAAAMPWRDHEIDAGAGVADGAVARFAAELAAYSGGAVISVGLPNTVTFAKAVATVATNPPPLSDYLSRGLHRRPRTHLAIPTGLWPAEEATSVLPLDDPLDGALPALEDPLLAPVALIDHRLHAGHDPAALREAGRLALAIASCVVTDDTRSLESHTIALAAAHDLADRTDASAISRRVALTLATAGHPDYPLCRRCRAGTRLLMDATDEPTTPAEICLRQALNY